MNRFQLIGNLGSDAILRTYTKADGAQTEYCHLSVCVNTPAGKDKAGKTITRADWFSLAIFQPNLVELMKKYGSKGKKILVEGEMIQETQGEGENRRYITKFRVGFGGRIELLSPSSDSAEPGSNDAQRPAVPHGDMDDEIPF